MYNYRVTKYNPLHRDDNGIYHNDEWASISDIGQAFNGIELEFKSYRLYEDAYIQSIDIVMNVNNITSLEVRGLEQRYVHDYPDMKKKDILRFIKELKNGELLNKEKINFTARLILREMIWCKLINEQELFVHFGYDYYMYIGSNKKLDKEIILLQSNGLFVEEFQSPYL